MKEALAFVSVAVGTKSPSSFISVGLNGVRAYNGMLSAFHPTPVGVDCEPDFAGLSTALAKLGDKVSYSVSDDERLVLKAGKVKVRVPCLPAGSHYPELPHAPLPFDGENLVYSLTRLLAYAAKEASVRPWLSALLVAPEGVYATDGVFLAHTPWPTGMDPVVLPLPFVKAICKQKQAPEAYLTDGRFFAVVYREGAWIGTALYEEKWPDVAHVLKTAKKPVTPLSPEQMTVLEQLRGLGAVGEATVKEGVLYAHTTAGDVTFSETGFADGRYSLSTLTKVGVLASAVNWGDERSAGFFVGEDVTGCFARKG